MGSIDLITDWVPAGTLISDWFNISHPGVVYCGTPIDEVVACTEPLDSIFHINLRTGRIGVLFYPAGVRLASDKDHYVFYARGGFRLFVTPAGSGLQ
jgi:hypothetical protein